MIQRADRLSAGYTLIEILIVIFIISIVTSVALLSISHNENKRLESFTREFVQIMTLAEEQAMLQPTVLGLKLDKYSYQFASYHSPLGEQKNPWVPLQDKILGNHKIPSNIQLDMKMTGKQVSDSSDSAQTNLPQIIISTNGDITPFTIYVAKRGQKPRYVIKGEADGSISSHSLS
ncbi:MAG: type II secretion system minor pseudopilin GspH [Gammaproteobacteria bacterium]|nr:type II secretion system minor pseudopilin GspH [Gammaproteobacteria bacterium]MCW5583397.1 type II secretion system minor pseudopilin GspH [Gammaproteobacteria bacterium]